MTNVESTISQVTVYPDRARVVRSGRSALPAGPQTLVFSDLPLLLDPDSVRAAAHGTASARLLGVSTELVSFRESPAEQVTELETQIQALKDEDAGYTDQLAVLQEQLQHLDGLASQTETFARGLAFGRTTVSDQTTFLAFVQERSLELRRQVLELQVKQRELAKSIKKLLQDLKHLTSLKPRNRHVARIELEMLKEGELDVELTYSVSGASWKPLYDLRFWEATEERPEPALELNYLAQVQQETGEDWNEVSLALSTARPAATGALPELAPWYVDVFVPRPTPAVRAKAARMTDEMTFGAAPDAEPAAMMAMAPSPVAAQAATATVDSSGTAVTFRVNHPVSIPADGEPHKTTVTHYDLRPKMDYLAAPKLSDAAYRRATVTNTTEAVFLPGAASVFAGEDFIGATKLDLIAPNEEFEVALGVDDRIKIERELVSREVDKSLIGDKRRLHYGYRIEVQNLRPVAETILIQDNYPVARHEQIKVKLDAVNPPPTQEEKLHLLEWQLTLEPGAKATITFDVNVEHPRSLSVVGLLD